MRKGRFDKKEIAFITENCDNMSVDELGERLGRDPDSVKRFIRKKLQKGISKQESRQLNAEYDLKSRFYWKDLKEQFSSDELEMFLYHWRRMIAQFKDDVFHTEEMQVVDAIKLEILMNRALKEQQKGMREIAILEDELADEKDKGVNMNSDRVFNLERQVAVSRASLETLSRDYKDLQTKKNAMLKELKGTREQRIKQLEDSKQTFVGWVKEVANNAEFRNQLSVDMEKMRIAVQKEAKKLSEYHTYGDGMVDQPFLTAETVKDD